MRVVSYLFIPILFFVLIVCSQKQEQESLCGTWKMVSGIYKGPDFMVKTDESKRSCYKLLSQDHFAVIEMFKSNPESLFFAAVGSYELIDTSYVENYEACNIPSKVGESEVFFSTVKGDTWRIRMKKEDMELDETWVRIKKPE